MKTRINIILLISLFAMLMSSCVQDISTDEIIDTNYESTQINTTTVFGVVTDDYDYLVQSAKIVVMNSIESPREVFTNENGYFEIFDVKIIGKTIILKVEYPEAFTEEFHLQAIHNSVVEANIVVSMKDLFDNRMTQDGGTLSNGTFEITFPPNCFADLDDKIYSGEVYVYYAITDPFEDIYTSINNGSYRAFDKDGSPVSQTVYRKLHVELIGENGEELQIKSGHTIQTKIKVQDDLLNQVEGKSFTMMHYDEMDNAWEEEAEGSVANGYYTANLPHFSSWTWCDIFSNPLNISGTVKLMENGIDYNAQSYVIFDFGFVSFMVPPAANGDFNLRYGPSDVAYDLYVLNECEETIHTASYSGANDSFDLGIIEIETPQVNNHSLTVHVYNCDSTSVSNGYSRLCIDELSFQHCQVIPIINGELQYSFPDCELALNGELYLLNEENLLTTDPVKFDLEQQDIILPYVALCDTFKDNITLYVNGNLFYQSHDIDYSASSNPSNGFQSGDILGNGVSISTVGMIESDGQYPLRYVNIQNADFSIYASDWNPNGIVDVQNFITNSGNPGWGRPEHIEVSFSGQVEQKDYDTGSVIGNLLIEGTVYID